MLHAPRQTGKTTTLAALAGALNATGEYAAVRFSCERASLLDDPADAEARILDAIRIEAENAELAPECLPPTPWSDASRGNRLFHGLRTWAEQCPRKLVLLIDEIDSLKGPVLVSALRLLRDGYTSANIRFPHSVVLCGMRNVRDYKAASGGDPTRLGTSSPFNISAGSLRIDDFSMSEIAELYGQHTDLTGQKFSDEAVERAYHASQGQPWLVNALARDIIEMMEVPADEEITDELMDRAVERLIAQRATHLDSLAARLHEPRVSRFIQPMITGGGVAGDATYDDDLSYVRDLGLVTRASPPLISNPIYQEVIGRVLSHSVQHQIDAEPKAFLLPDGRLDVPKIQRDFVAFWKANAEILDTDRTYHEAACHLVFQAFLQRVVNGGGLIDREYALGRRRLDLMIHKPYLADDGRRALQQSAFELKVRSEVTGDQIADGLEQLDGYLDRLGLDTGTLVVFDRRRNAPPVTERTSIGTAESPSGRVITLIRA
ncbi:AAA family ATPase [Actinomadura harenae]|uniref:AAA family ATPase n=1 Tax=Actinomadura harenae TaxID=2483351 RepID=UPI0018F65102|nr:AAA family ATPase [Actinomadura harenae]